MFTLGLFTKEDIYMYDLFNSRHTRKDYELAGESSDYNCMAYAFNAFEWMVPFDYWAEKVDDLAEEINLKKKRHIDELEDALAERIYEHPFLMKLAITRMLKHFKGLRRVKSFKELNDDEYGIVYACGDGDFHFGICVRGQWSHKMGSQDVVYVENEDKVFGWRYYGPRVYFAMKIGEVEYEA